MSDIQSRQLRCGMPLIVERMSGVRSAAMCWALPAGCAADPDNRQGMSAMWSELLLRGAGPLSSREHADAMDRLGAARSVSAGTYTMGVGTTLLGNRLLEALPLIVDMVLAPRMDPDSIDPARDLCLQAIESVKDDPQERAMLAARERHHPAPISRSGMGTPEGLNALTRDELIQTWQRTALPGRSIFAAAGAVDIDPLAARLDQLLAAWSGTTTEPPLGPPAPRGYGHQTDSTNQVQVIVVHDAPPDNAASATDSLIEKVIVSVLSGGMSGRLFSEVREKRGLCYSVSAGYRGDRDFGSITAYVGTTPERAQESLDVLIAELNRINKPEGRITPEEFQRAIIGMKSGLIFSGESSGARATALAADQRKLGRPRSLNELAKRVDELTLDQVNAYLTNRRLGRLTIQTLGPRELCPPA